MGWQTLSTLRNVRKSQLLCFSIETHNAQDGDLDIYLCLETLVYIIYAATQYLVNLMLSMS